MEVILEKMKWDEEADPDDVDDDDKVAFEGLRKVWSSSSYQSSR
jgi:exportin-T